MKYSVISLFILSLLLSFTSCKNDLKIFAPGKESISVYGILNVNQSVQNIRINKVYLTTGDALAAGQDAGQINYGPNELKVTLQRFVTGTTTPTLTSRNSPTRKEIVLTETVVTTQDGTFNNQQRIWQTTDKLYNTGDYKLTITNNSTGAIFTSQTTIIDSVRSAGSPQPMPFLYIAGNAAYPVHGGYPAFPNPNDKPKYVNYDQTNITYAIKFHAVPYARLYDVTMRFHYIDTLLSGGVNYNYVDYNFTTLKSPDLNGGYYMEGFTFTGDAFYKNLASEMAKKGNTNIRNRAAFYMEYIIAAGSEDLSDFLEINAPSNTIAQDKPLYTNITGGVGVFSSRSTSVVSKDIWGDFMDQIGCNPDTYPYLFCKSSGAPASSPCN